MRLGGGDHRHGFSGREKKLEYERVEQILPEIQPSLLLLWKLEVVVPSRARGQFSPPVREIKPRKALVRSHHGRSVTHFHGPVERAVCMRGAVIIPESDQRADFHAAARARAGS